MRRLLAALVPLLFPLSGAAALIPFNFTTLAGGVNNTLLNNSETTLEGVTASGFNGLTSSPTLGSASGNAPLWLRNEGPSDHGLGVCSEDPTNTTNTSVCVTGTGDVNEISNETTPPTSEGILLSRPINTRWNQLLVSSLDAGGSGDNESGILFWSNTLTFNSADSLAFSHNTLLADEGPLALPLGFNTAARYLLFTNSFTNEHNNDYLVLGGRLSEAPELNELSFVPEPATIALLGLGLAGLGFSRRKKG